MTIGNEIRKLLFDKDVTLTQMADIIAKEKNKPYSVQNLSQKLKSNTLYLNELEIILKYLGYEIRFFTYKK